MKPDELLKVSEEILNTPEEIFKFPIIKGPVKTSKNLVNTPKPKEGYFSFSCDYDSNKQS